MVYFETLTLLIASIYNSKPKTIDIGKTVREAIDMMDDEFQNGRVVISGKDTLEGVLSVQDIAAAIIPTEFKENPFIAKAMYVKGYFHERCNEIRDKKVSEIMRTDFTTVSLQDNIMAIMADFLVNDLYIVPVVDGKKLIGVITRTEIKKALSEGMELNKVDY